MNKTALIYIFDGFADWESAYISTELNAPGTGWTVKTLAPDLAPKTSMGGLRVLPDYEVGSFPEDFGALLLVGGNTWLDGTLDVVLPVAEYAAAHGIPMGGICNAVNFLAEYGFLDGVAHTGNTLPYLTAHCPHYRGAAHYQDRQYVRDGGVITANGTAALEFTREVLLELSALPEEVVQAHYQLQKQGYYPA